MFIKMGELMEVSSSDIQPLESVIPVVDEDILNKFAKFASSLKKIAPKAQDFLYFICTMMHSAEASSINDDGSPKLTRNGESVVVGWDHSNDTWKWTSNDPSIRAYKNSNGDIFPESELIKAHKKWAGKPLCIDHKSSSVDHVRGFIVDTYYDRKLKRVIALCALDKAGYPQLARQVSTGVSTCVSMGTAVGRAICYDCATAARTEHDFCKHMKTKTGYGEINVDLNPIELSIVVNGADPKAHIKEVLAAANHLNAYVESKQGEIEKLADLKFNAQLSGEDDDEKEGAGYAQINISAKDLVKFKQDLDEAFGKLSNIYDLTKKYEKDSNSLAYNQSSGSAVMTEGSQTGSELSLQTPQTARFAALNTESDSVNELKDVTMTIEANLKNIQESLEKLSKTSKKQEEEMMSDMNKKGYYQGGGGVNEPTPGQSKYPKDGLNEQLRNHSDKQMVGQSPFPGVGDVEGLHPSPASVDISDELERKKMLARAEANERAVKRAAIVSTAKSALESKGYFNGGGGVNEPTPGKVKYPVDKLNQTLREKGDKQMVGQKPFPGVGDVDGLHPSPASVDVPDELKRKQMLQRASLRARFVKAAKSDGSQNKADSAWEVFLGDKLILTASVNELTGGRTEMLYDQIATKQFGSKLIEQVKTAGAPAVAALFKKAQPAPAATAAPAPEAPAEPEAPAMGDALAPLGEDTGKDGDPKDNALELAEKARDVTSDLLEVVRSLTGEQAEMGANENPSELAAAAAGDRFSTAALKISRAEVNGQLVQAMKEVIANLNSHQEELRMIASMYDNGAVRSDNKELVSNIASDSIKETKKTIADGLTLMNAFVKYARATNALVKRAEMEAELEALAEGDSMSDTKDDTRLTEGTDLMALISDTNADLETVKEMLDGKDDKDEELSGEHESDDNDMKLEVAPGEAVPKDVPAGAQVEVKQASLESKAGRAILRAKLAADALGREDDGELRDMSKEKFNDLLDKAHALTDGQVKLDNKPSGNLGLVETIEEQNAAMLQIAKAPPKVRKEAEAIQKLVASGQLDAKDVDALVAEGLDKDAVAYWKKFYGEAEGGSEFAAELVKEHVKTAMASEIEKYELKIARAYELAYDMVERGLVSREKHQIQKEVGNIMKFDDQSFESLKRVVARHQPLMQKQASYLPNVGLNADEAPTKQLVKNDLVDSLSAMFGNRKGSF